MKSALSKGSWLQAIKHIRNKSEVRSNHISYIERDLRDLALLAAKIPPDMSAKAFRPELLDPLFESLLQYGDSGDLLNERKALIAKSMIDRAIQYYFDVALATESNDALARQTYEPLIRAREITEGLFGRVQRRSIIERQLDEYKEHAGPIEEVKKHNKMLMDVVEGIMDLGKEKGL